MKKPDNVGQDVVGPHRKESSLLSRANASGNMMSPAASLLGPKVPHPPFILVMQSNKGGALTRDPSRGGPHSTYSVPRAHLIKRSSRARNRRFAVRIFVRGPAGGPAVTMKGAARVGPSSKATERWGPGRGGRPENMGSTRSSAIEWGRTANVGSSSTSRKLLGGEGPRGGKAVHGTRLNVDL
ncbi:hypothetical protein H6P81_012013 [Aristolochia fimbriata]|uniref:Uncharacterized protein n=1 Tax=Aristolochia fimbriata TaxID=158543 RepID=A0AAV7ECR0_ARIFI|nr:hypothetical protein H6P81_012013 [Aristolochia fimbriata]